jgi:hypothetical protein
MNAMRYDAVGVRVRYTRWDEDAEVKKPGTTV